MFSSAVVEPEVEWNFSNENTFGPEAKRMRTLEVTHPEQLASEFRLVCHAPEPVVECMLMICDSGDDGKCGII